MSPSATSDPTATFFDDLGERGHEANLERLTGTIRFDLARRNRTDSWLVAIRKGDVAISREPAEADCVLSTAKRVFDGLVTGEQNPLAATLRGEVAAEGNLELLVLFQRLFPWREG
jgi:putative sterol carrier protein